MNSFLTPQRIFLGLMTALVAVVLGTELFSTLQESQIQDRLDLQQTRLVLQASAWEPGGANLEQPELSQLRSSLLGTNPVGDALEKYQTITAALQSDPGSGAIDPLQWSQTEIDRLLIEQGLLEVLNTQSDQPLPLRLERAQQQWQWVVEQADGTPADGTPDQQQTALILQGLWQNPPRLLPDAQETLTHQLEGWFRYRSLERLYDLQQRPEAIVALREKEQMTVQRVLKQLFILTGLPLIGMGLGVITVITLLVRGLVQRWRNPRMEPSGTENSTATIASSSSPSSVWTVPWSAETIWQGVVLGFFLVGQIGVVRFLIPILLLSFRSVVGVSVFQTVKVQALLVVIVYGGMSIAVLTFFYFLLRPFWPLPSGWFRIRFEAKAIGWGILGYFMALPLVTLVSFLNQQLWDGQGGSNPMLFLALRNQDWFALGCFFFTAALLAPLFEEWLFRGFLMVSLTRYLPQFGAILLSGLIFAVAHLSLSEILPLWTLGSILGYVYGRSQNLVSAIVLHSLWNSGTLIGLTVLGSHL
jgi:membrane protease YdiL (CAAX protease family)